MNETNLDNMANETLRIREKIKSLGQDDNNFCLVPFTTIILEPDGKVGMCRNKGSKFSIGNIQENTIQEIWNGEEARKWRREFLEGKPVNCAKEVRHRHCQHCHQNNKLLDFVEFSEIQTKPILKLTANFNGKCNLQCQMCDIWQQPNGLYNHLNFWEPARKEIFPFLKEVDLLSGEPFIQSDTYRLINEISEVNPECEWTFTTNMHWKLTDKIKCYLDKIRIKNIIMSVDSFNSDIYYKIRYPGKLDFVLKNIEAFFKYNKSRKQPTSLVLNFLVQKDNWHEIHTAYEFCYKNNIEPFITFLYEPARFSLLTLGEGERVKVIEGMFEQLSRDQLIRSMRVIMPLLDSLNSINRASALLNLRDRINNNIKI